MFGIDTTERFSNLTVITGVQEITAASQEIAKVHSSLFVLHHRCVRLSKAVSMNRHLLNSTLRQWK